MTFRPLDVPVFDIDWPMMDGRVHGLHDIKVVVHGTGDFDVPCDVVVTTVTSNSITLALANRSNGSIYAGTYLTATGVGGRGVSSGFDNGIMDVVITTDGTALSKTSGNLRVMPTCVMWLNPSGTVFTGDELPVPWNGWTRSFDYDRRVVAYTGNDLGEQPPTPGKLMMVNGVSPLNLTITSDGAADFSGTNTVVITPRAQQ